VLELVVGQAARTVATGLVVGLALALAAGRLVSALLYQTSPTDPGVLVAVGIVMLVVAAFASLLPAWRAAGVDPAIALRVD
jgi:putative ABC transport system permease protein